MAKYRKKPVVIEAMQFDGANHFDICRWAANLGGKRELHFHDGVIDIPTLEGTMTASAGDFIICGVKGELYPCKPDIFAETNEPATPTPPSASVEEALREARKALRCLYIAVPEQVADDVWMKCEAAFAAVRADEQAKRPTVPELVKIDQTTFGNPKGNCLAACVATITGIPLAKLCDELVWDDDGEHWYDTLRRVLTPLGWEVNYDPEWGCPSGYCIASGDAERGLRHSVVYRDGKLYHDPHPSRAGLLNEQYYLTFTRIARPTVSRDAVDALRFGIEKPSSMAGTVDGASFSFQYLSISVPIARELLAAVEGK